LKRKVVALAVGKEKDIKKFLEEKSIQGLLHDGKLQVEDLCELEGRCWWHVVYTVRYLLYHDGIKGKQNKWLRRKLAGILFDEDLCLGERTAKILDWIKENEADAPVAIEHVKRALDGLQNIEANPELFEVRTTGPLEREMKEINKRFENGGGWTQEGAESLLWHFQ
jgi:hypothetical protein